LEVSRKLSKSWQISESCFDKALTLRTSLEQAEKDGEPDQPFGEEK